MVYYFCVLVEIIFLRIGVRDNHLLELAYDISVLTNSCIVTNVIGGKLTSLREYLFIF